MGPRSSPRLTTSLSATPRPKKRPSHSSPPSIHGRARAQLRLCAQAAEELKAQTNPFRCSRMWRGARGAAGEGGERERESWAPLSEGQWHTSCSRPRLVGVAPSFLSLASPDKSGPAHCLPPVLFPAQPPFPAPSCTTLPSPFANQGVGRKREGTHHKPTHSQWPPRPPFFPYSLTRGPLTA